MEKGYRFRLMNDLIFVMIWIIYRPELVSEFFRRTGKSLSSDALSHFSREDPQSNVHNSNACHATQILVNEIIPECAIEMANRISFIDFRLDVFLHQRGVNMRHLGLLRSLLPESAEKAKSLILIEIVAR